MSDLSFLEVLLAVFAGTVLRDAFTTLVNLYYDKKRNQKLQEQYEEWAEIARVESERLLANLEKEKVEAGKKALARKIRKTPAVKKNADV